MASGTATSGGARSFVATREHAAGRAWVVVSAKQHAEDHVGMLIDIVEVSAAQTGLVTVDAEAIGRDLAEQGRVVLDALAFDFDGARLLYGSDRALQAVVTHLAATPDAAFHVVGHRDTIGRFDYNRGLSLARAQAVVEALVAVHGVARERLAAHGVGPRVPVFSDGRDAGRDRYRRVEVGERLP